MNLAVVGTGSVCDIDEWVQENCMPSMIIGGLNSSADEYCKRNKISFMALDSGLDAMLEACTHVLAFSREECSEAIKLAIQRGISVTIVD